MIRDRKGARLISVDARSAYIAPASVFSGAGLWVVSLDGFCCDVLCTDEADAEATAKRTLEHPDCPTWIATPAHVLEQEINNAPSELSMVLTSYVEAA